MLMTVAASRLPWLAAFAMIVGTLCLALHERDAAMLLIGAGIAWGTTVAQAEAQANKEPSSPP